MMNRKVGMSTSLLAFAAVLGFALSITLGTGDANAAHGEVVGTIYSTDILAKVNGVPVESYNIGGRTLIVAEDLSENSDCRLRAVYDDGQRLWTIDSMLYERNEMTELTAGTGGDEVGRGASGTVPSRIYSTDVRVLFNGKPVTAYDIGGRTAVCLEDLGVLDGSPNKEYGYSEYLAGAVWNERDRVVELLTFNPNASEITGNNVHSYEYTCIDNVLYAEYSPMNEYYSCFSHETGNTYNYTDQFEKDYFTLRPFYLNVDGEDLEVGSCVISNLRGFDETVFRLTDVEGVKALLNSAKPPARTYGEAMEYLCSSDEYVVESRADNEGYTVLLLREADTDGLYVVAVKKAGGYLRLFGYPGDHSDVSFSLEENTVVVEVYPFAGPHGATTMVTTFDLDEHEFSSATAIPRF